MLPVCRQNAREVPGSTAGRANGSAESKRATKKRAKAGMYFLTPLIQPYSVNTANASLINLKKLVPKNMRAALQGLY